MNIYSHAVFIHSLLGRISMELKTFCVSLISLTLLGLVGSGYAGNFAPEHIECKLVADQLKCDDFNRQYLTEHTFTANFPDNQLVLFSFSSAVAYVTAQREWSLFFTYKDVNQKNVTLKSIKSNSKPVFANGAWIKLRDDTYSCDAGYRSCQFTN